MLNKNEFLKQLGELVAIPTISGDQESNQQAINYIASLLSPKAKIKRIKNGQAEILIAGTNETLNPMIGYMVHVDVVSATKPRFSMKQKDNLIFGRGVSDMKFSIPLGIALLNELLENKSKLTFSLAITTDEETGGFEGGAYLAHTLGWRPETLIVPDGGDNLAFVKAAKGVGQFLIESYGKSAHASRVWQGKNAITPLAQLITELEKRYKKNNSTEGWLTTVNFGQISGGVSTNQVCDSATLKIDFRYPETDTIKRITRELNSLIKSLNGQLKVTPLSTGLPTFTDPNLPIVKQFLQAFEEIYLQKIEVKRTHGASDARHFAKYSIPILMIKPLGGDIHMESEWLDIDSTMKFYEALRKFLQQKEGELND
jgi:succinyl-diaminopimelate desuccinylase